MELYKIEQALLDAWESAVDPETGEVLDDQAVTMIDMLEMERDEKYEQLLLWIKDLKAEAAAIKAEKKALADREAAVTKKADRLAAYMQTKLEGEKFKTARVSVSYRKSQSVEVNNMLIIPGEYLRFKDPEVDKMAVKAALKEGEEVPGCTLVDNVTMTIK